MTDGRTDGLALAHPYHERRSGNKFGKITPSDLGGDSVTDSLMDD